MNIRNIAVTRLLAVTMLVMLRNEFTTGAARGTRMLVRRISMSSVAEGQTRISSCGISLDSNLMAENPALVKSHLSSRRASQSLLDEVDKVSNLREERNTLIVVGDAARSERKKASQVIGQLMKEGKESEVTALKIKVEEYGINPLTCTVYLSICLSLGRLFVCRCCYLRA